MATAFVFTLYTSSVQFLLRALEGRQGQSRTEVARSLYGNSCNFGAVVVRSSYHQHENRRVRAAFVLRLRKDGAVNVRSPCLF